MKFSKTQNKKSGSKSLMEIKINMEKAFDYMESIFQLTVLNGLGFHLKWINNVKECISTISFLVVIDGEPNGFLTPSWGALRQ